MSKIVGFNRRAIVIVFTKEERDAICQVLRNSGQWCPHSLTVRIPPMGVRFDRLRGGGIQTNNQSLDWYKTQQANGNFTRYRFISAAKFIEAQKGVTNSGKE